MATKPYLQSEDTSHTANEPSATYQIDNSTLGVYHVSDAERESLMRAKAQFTRGEFCTESEMDKMVEEWLS